MRPRYMANHRKDLSEPDIVKDLKKAHCQVYDRLPDDLLVWHPSFGDNWFRLLSVKTADEKGRIRKRKDQAGQDAFCELTGVPRVTDSEQALRKLGVIA